jgi:hypothetical protein
LHNANVFSTIDNFQYKDNPSDKSETYKYLDFAEADYYVLGWHSNADDDPLSKVDTSLPPSLQSLSKRMAKLMLKSDPMLPTSTDRESQDIGSSAAATRCILHGAIYGVIYNRTKKPKCRADTVAQNFGPRTRIEPLSVGSTPIDAFVTFLEAHRNDAMVDVFGVDSKDVASNILKLSELLYSADDSYNARIKAADLLQQNNYASSAGGQRWVYAGTATPGGPGAQPLGVQTDSLLTLNKYQKQLDVTERMLASSRWQLFAEWWKFVSDQENTTSNTKQQAYVAAVRKLKKEVKDLQQIKDDLKGPQGKIEMKSKEVPCKAASTAPYFLRKDPTLCIAGLDSGWPIDYLNAINVRLDHELYRDAQIADAVKNQFSFQKLLLDLHELLPLDDSMKATVKRLVVESHVYKTGDPKKVTDPSKTTDPSNTIDPNQITTGFKSWGGENPFIPLFIEFEVLYYHIPLEKWSVSLRSSPVGHKYHQVRYGLNSTLYDDPNQDNQKDWRTASGRVLILPQPVFSLEATVNAVLDTAGTLPISNDDADYLRKHIKQLQFISAPLSGITNHLLTRVDGGHVVPNLRGQGETPRALIAAVKPATVPAPKGSPQSDAPHFLEAEEVKEIIQLINSESALTPYGNLFNFGSDYPGTPFKGITSGQMTFTKINIIDKFGQAICLPDPVPRPRPRTDIQPVHPLTVHPCISDYLMPGVLTDQSLNTVYFEAGHTAKPWPMSRFMQLAPSINQEARINPAFVIPPDGHKNPTWHEASDFVVSMPAKCADLYH